MINTLSPEELHANLAAAVVAMHPDLVVQWSKAVIDNGYSAMDAINSGLAQGMKEVGRLFAEEEYFVFDDLCNHSSTHGTSAFANSKPHSLF